MMFQNVNYQCLMCAASFKNYLNVHPLIVKDKAYQTQRRFI